MKDVIKRCTECGSVIDDDGVPLNCTGECGGNQFLANDDYKELNFNEDVVRELDDLEPEVDADE